MSLPRDVDVIRASFETPAAFAELFDRHARAVQGYAVRRSGSSSAADDIVAQTFLTAFEKRHTFDPANPDARPWLLGIATNHLRSLRRAEARSWGLFNRAVAALDSAPDDGGVGRLLDRLDAQSSGAALVAVLPTLSDGDRDVLLLFAWEDLSYAEIAQALDIPVGTVRSRLNRARRLLQFALRRFEQEETG
ncbi:MAG: polymerase, sigma-24 subunit, subfamily [Aeromicrobium sp.]|nr:polymerase, sigma-24 subunit, subfamily [Aeromicrobium sp.]